MPHNLRFRIIPLLLLPSLSAAQTQDDTIRWRIENPFRLFRNAADFERLRIPANSSIKDWFSGIAHQINDDFLPYRRTHWDPLGGSNSTGHYSPGYMFPQSHRILLSLSKATPDERCNWQIGTRSQHNVSCKSITADIPYDYRDKDATTIVTATVIDKRGEPVRRASTPVSVRDKLVLAIGDSYTAGQGAPDRPARLSFRDSKLVADPFRRCDEDKACVWFPELKTGQPAEWWDAECNRSLLAWPVLAALKLASHYADQAQREDGTSEKVQYAVTFASYACSGAEFFDGIFLPQRNPPGQPKNIPLPYGGSPGAPTVQHSQLRAAGADQCDIPNGERTSSYGIRRIDYYKCEQPRLADVVLMSVGGNDSGFANVIMRGLLPEPEEGNDKAGALSLATMHALLGTVTIEKSKMLRERMLPNYSELEKRLKPFVAPEGKVLVMGYPNLLMRPLSLSPEGGVCGLEMRSGMEAARLVGYPIVKSWWHFWYRHSEAARTVNEIIKPLQDKIAAASISNGWTYVNGHFNDFEQHGLCADAAKIENDSEKPQPSDALHENVTQYGLPRQRWNNGSPVHLDKQEWLPYDTAQKRWVRTPNDSVLTQTTSTLRASLHGAFHPNGAGYAAMAQAAFERMLEPVNNSVARETEGIR